MEIDWIGKCHLAIALVFLAISPLLPLSPQWRKGHRILGYSYGIGLLFLVVSGFWVSRFFLVFEWENIHSWIRLFIRNLAPLVYTYFGIVSILSLKRPSSAKRAVLAVLASLLLVLGCILTVYGLIPSWISVSTDRSTSIRQIFGIYPSYVLLGIFFTTVAVSFLKKDLSSSLSVEDKIRRHRRHMSAALFLTLISVIMVEMSEIDPLRIQWYMLSGVSVAILAYISESRSLEKALLYKPNRRLGFGIALVVILFASWIYISNEKSETVQKYVVSMKLVPKGVVDPALAHFSCEHRTKLPFKDLDTGEDWVLLLDECRTFRELKHQFASNAFTARKRGKLAVGLAKESLAIPVRSHIYPILVAIYGQRITEAKKQEIRSRIEERGCHVGYLFDVVKYIRMLRDTERVEFFSCPELRMEVGANKNSFLKDLAREVSGQDAKIIVARSRVRTPQEKQVSESRESPL